MRLRLTVGTRHAGSSTDVTVIAEPEAPADEVLDAIGRTVGTDGTLSGSHGPLPSGGPLGASGLHDGDVLGIGGPGRSMRDRVDNGVELRVVGGPSAGLVFRLGRGKAVVGRLGTCTVTIPDPELSREHAAIEIDPDGQMTVCDLASANGTSVEGAGVGADPVRVDFEQVVQVGASYVSLHRVDPLDADLTDDGQCGYVFNRRYRIHRPTPPVQIEFPVLPAEEEKPTFPWAMMLAPLVLAPVLFIASHHNPLSFLMVLMSPVMVAGSTLNDRRTRKRRHARKGATYDELLATATERADVAVQEERSRRRNEAPDPAVNVLTATGPRGRLWERRGDDADGLCLRLGLATQPSVVEMLNHPSPPPAWAVPVVVPLRSVGVLGVAAPVGIARAVARSLMNQLAILHSPDDVRIGLLTDESAGSDWDWVRWLPHTQLDESRGVVAIGNDLATVANRVKELQKTISSRSEERRVGGHRPPPLPNIVVLIDGAKRWRSLPGMLSLLREGPAVGVYSICLDEDQSLLPEECGAVAAWDEGEGLAVVELHGMPTIPTVALDQVVPQLCEAAARAIAPIHRIGGEAGGGIPSTARLAELTGLDPPTSEAVVARWADPGRGPRTVLGVAEYGPLVLDLAADGPHGLVAGTTGSGKSELLQTLVAGLAVSSPPDELNVVLVDYKGGAAFKDFKELPHTVGIVTDLDAHLTERALRSLQAELKRREHLLATAGTKDIGDYIDARSGGRSDLPPLPRLVLIIDEFASLALELPDFIKGLVGIAQRGRSLGIHLVLATQRPTGVVSPEIRANANFAVALRVVNGTESSDIIGTQDAGTISPATPGRAFLRISQETPTCFQSARVGGRRPGAIDVAAPVTVVPTPWTALGYADPAAPAAAAPSGDVTDLHELVAAVREAADQSGIAKQRQPWLEPLPPVLTLDDLPKESPESRTTPAGTAADSPFFLPYGLSDLPDQQAQRPALFDPLHGHHLLVAGSPRSGRSSMLRTIAGAVARSCSVDDVHLYAIDCGNGGLLALRDLPHCGGVITRNEPDRAERLLGRLTEEVRRRQSTLVERGLTSIVEQHHQPGGEAPWPLMVLLVDGWEGFLDTFHDLKDGSVEQLLLGLVRDGGAVGLTVVVTGDRVLLSNSRVSSLFAERFVLRFNDRDDYSLADLSPRRMPESVAPGRAFRAVSGEEMQVALLDSDPAGPAQAAALASLAAAARDRATAGPPSSRPIRVDPLPARVTLAEAMSLVGGSGSGNGSGRLSMMVGVGGDELTPVWVDLAEHGPGFVVTGSPESGRSTALLSFGSSLLAQGCPVVAVVPRPSPLRSLAGHQRAVVLEGASARAPGPEGAAAVESLRAQHDGQAGTALPVVVLVDDAELVDADDSWLNALAGEAPGASAVVVAGSLEPLRDGFRGFPLMAKRGGNGLLLSPRSHLDAAVFNGSLSRGSAFSGPAGRSFLFLRSRAVALLQVPVP